MRHPLGDSERDLGTDFSTNELGPDAAAFLEAVLGHELSLRPRVRCVVTGSTRTARRSAATRARAQARSRAKRSARRA